MIEILSKFFKERGYLGQPLLLAFSGGPDSLALLYLLKESKKNFPLNFALAHVDHGWRKESEQEVEKIKCLAENLGLDLHLKKLDPVGSGENLEAVCREERLKFFSSLCREYGYEAVLLAHHADDLAETVLKRTFEGVTLPYLSSIRNEVNIYGMKVWRPLLSVSKRKILEWLKEHHLQGFFDKTNLDPQFLRGRMRLTLLPYLSETFGKNVSRGLCQIAEEAGELRDYMDERIHSYKNQIVTGKWGTFLDLNPCCPSHFFELKYLIRQFCKESFFGLSREGVSQAAHLVLERKANKSFSSGNKGEKTLYLDRSRLFIPVKKFSSLLSPKKKVDMFNPTQYGEWKIEVTPYNKTLRMDKKVDWRSFWQEGNSEVVLPMRQYEVSAPDRTLTKKWQRSMIPAFFRNEIPVIREDGKVRHEFLTGKLDFSNQVISEDLIKLSISRD